MKMRAFVSALKFVCLPTLAVLVLLFFGFFSLSATIAFITSNSTPAVILRVAMVLGEIVVVFLMYRHYIKDEIRLNPQKDERKRRVSYSSEVREIFKYGSTRDDYYMYNTPSPDLKLIERVAADNS